MYIRSIKKPAMAERRMIFKCSSPPRSSTASGKISKNAAVIRTPAEKLIIKCSLSFILRAKKPPKIVKIKVAIAKIKSKRIINHLLSFYNHLWTKSPIKNPNKETAIPKTTYFNPILAAIFRLA